MSINIKRRHVSSWWSALSALAGPVCYAVILYLATASLFMPMRAQRGINPLPICPDGGPAWLDVAAALLIAFVLGMLRQLLAGHAARSTGTKPLIVIAALTLSPTYAWIGRWYWEPAAAGMLDSSTRGSSLAARCAVVISLVVITLAFHALIVLLVAAVFAAAVVAAKVLLGAPITWPCLNIALFGDPNGLIRVKCNPLPVDQWYDLDALKFAIGLCIVWAVLSIGQGMLAVFRAARTVDRFR